MLPLNFLLLVSVFKNIVEQETMMSAHLMRGQLPSRTNFNKVGREIPSISAAAVVRNSFGVVEMTTREPLLRLSNTVVTMTETSLGKSTLRPSTFNAIFARISFYIVYSLFDITLTLGVHQNSKLTITRQNFHKYTPFSLCTQ